MKISESCVVGLTWVMKDSLGDAVTIIKVDVDKNPQAAAAFQVQGVPTLIVFKNGKEVARATGDTKESALAKLTKQAI